MDQVRALWGRSPCLAPTERARSTPCPPRAARAPLSPHPMPLAPVPGRSASRRSTRPTGRPWRTPSARTTPFRTTGATPSAATRRQAPRARARATPAPLASDAGGGQRPAGMRAPARKRGRGGAAVCGRAGSRAGAGLSQLRAPLRPCLRDMRFHPPALPEARRAHACAAGPGPPRRRAARPAESRQMLLLVLSAAPAPGRPAAEADTTVNANRTGFLRRRHRHRCISVRAQGAQRRTGIAHHIGQASQAGNLTKTTATHTAQLRRAPLSPA